MSLSLLDYSHYLTWVSDLVSCMLRALHSTQSAALVKKRHFNLIIQLVSAYIHKLTYSVHPITEYVVSIREQNFYILISDSQCEKYV